jgi:eukaryotic-like serine/threonine-protein kinase
MDNTARMTPDLTGTRKGDYEILGLLGTGGMGQVYKVRNVHSDRIEAMKVLLPSLAGQGNFAERFVREIKVLAALHHPNIAELRTALTIDNQLVMVMEYVEGSTLAARVQQGAIPYSQALGYIEQVLSALSYAHKQGIIHRDIKPANMMLTPQGVVKLMDFGIARTGDQSGLTVTDTTLGSLAYMSPEQIRGETVDARSDLYSVGVSLYEMVTAQRPFQGDNAFSAMQAHLQTQARPPIELQPDLPSPISQLIMMAIAKDPAARFQSADAFAAAIGSVKPQVAATAMAAPVVTPTPAPAPVAAPKAATSRVGPAVQQAPVPPPAARSTHRGLYIALGAVLALAVLALAGVYVPKYARTHANKAATAPQISPTGPAQTPAAAAPAATAASPATPEASPAEPTATAASPATPPASPAKPAATKARARAVRAPAAPAHSAAVPAKPPDQAQSAPAVPPGPDPAQLQALGDQLDQLASRAAAVNASLETLQKEQAAHGYGLRGDMVAAQQRMQTDLANAESALQAKDLDSAKKYAGMAETETEKLERFLGR